MLGLGDAISAAELDPLLDRQLNRQLNRHGLKELQAMVANLQQLV